MPGTVQNAGDTQVDAIRSSFSRYSQSMGGQNISSDASVVCGGLELRTERCGNAEGRGS